MEWFGSLESHILEPGVRHWQDMGEACGHREEGKAGRGWLRRHPAPEMVVGSTRRPSGWSSQVGE